MNIRIFRSKGTAGDRAIGKNVWQAGPECASLARSVAACILAAVLSAPTMANGAGPASGDLRVRGGIAAISFDERARVRVQGTEVSNGTVVLSGNQTFGGEVEYFLSERVSAAVNFGVPPVTRISGAGAMAPFQELGRVRYGMGALLGRWHAVPSAPLSPFVSLGVARLQIFDTTDSAVRGLRVDSAWSPVAQGGVDLRVKDRMGLYWHVSYAPLSTKAQGSVLGTPMFAKIRLAPTITQAGFYLDF